MLTNFVTGCTVESRKVTRGAFRLGEPDERKLRLQDNFLRGKTDNKRGAMAASRITSEAKKSNEGLSSPAAASDRQFTLPEIAKAARRWLAPEPLKKLLHELKGEVESQPALAPARATDRKRKRAYEKLRSLGKLHR